MKTGGAILARHALRKRLGTHSASRAKACPFWTLMQLLFP